MAGLQIKDVFREARLFTSRSIAIGLIMLALVSVLLVRLYFLQVVEYERYSTLSTKNRISLVPTPPVRGLIFDRNGVPLAQNVPSSTLEIIPDHVEDMDALLDELGQLVQLSRSDIKLFRRNLKRNAGFKSIVLRSQLSDEEAGRFAVNSYRFKGVDLSARLERHYPLRESGAHVMGYVGRISPRDLEKIDENQYRGINFLGKLGIESYYEDALRGSSGVKQVETNAHGRVVRTVSSTPSQPGKNLYLTIDSRLQAVAEKAMAGRRGAVVAIEPSSGEVLTFASTPTYDPNPFVLGIDSESYGLLRDSLDRPLLNRALRGRYAPGSTIKPFMGMAGIEFGRSPVNKVFCPGFYTLTKGGHRYRCWKHSGHGSMDMHDSIVQSCDVYFYDLARSLGIERIHDYLDEFGFGQKSGIDMHGESAALLPSREWKRGARDEPWYPGETVIAGIGQGYMLATPLQLASATSALANGGIRMRPHFLLAEQDPMDNQVIAANPREAMPIVSNSEVIPLIKDAMVDVTSGARGTARRIGAGSPYSIAAKTGTAQVIGIKQNEKYNEAEIDERHRDHALFIAYAPADNPRIAVAVIVENGGHGGSTAGPIARQVMDYYLLGKEPEA